MKEIDDFLCFYRFPDVIKPRGAFSTKIPLFESEKYNRDALLQKYYTADYFSKRTVRNMRQIEQVYVKDSHLPIIDKEMGEAMQLELERRRLFRGK